MAERVLHHSYTGKDYAQQSEARSACVDKLLDCAVNKKSSGSLTTRKDWSCIIVTMVEVCPVAK